MSNREKKGIKSVKRKIKQAMISSVHHLARCIPYHVCCYSNREPSINLSFYKKPQSSHRRAMYLVINLTIVDMHVCRRIFSLFSVCNLTLLMRHCSISALNPGTDINNWLSLRPLLHTFSNFIRSDACINSSPQYTALRHRLIKKWVYGAPMQRLVSVK